MSHWTDLPAHLDPDEELSPKRLAATIPWLNERALYEAIRAEPKRIHLQPGGRGGVISPRSFIKQAKALPPCRAPDCDRPALADNGGCSEKGHGHIGAKRPSSTGRRISASKRGERQLELAPDELTLTEAIRETGISHRVLTHGVTAKRADGRPTLRHRRVNRSGNQPDAIVFKRVEFEEDLAACPCSSPRCTKPAPGPSGRCGDHAAKVKYEAVELICQYEPCGKRFMRPGSWLKELEGRGHYCSNEHKGLAFDASQPPDYLQTLNPDGAREFHDKIAKEIKQDARAGSRRAAQATEHSPTTIREAYLRGEVDGELTERRPGTKRIEYDPYSLASWEAQRSGSNAAFGRLVDLIAEQRRAKIRELAAKGLSPDAIAQVVGVSAAKVKRALERRGNAIGRPRELSAEEECEIRQMAAKSYSQGRIAYLVGVTESQVQRFLAAEKTASKPP